MGETDNSAAMRVVEAATSVEAQVAMAQAALGVEVDLLHSTPRLRGVLRKAAVIATDMAHDHIGTEHVVLAILGDRNSIPYRVFSATCDPSEFVDSLRSLMLSSGYQSSSTALPSSSG